MYWKHINSAAVALLSIAVALILISSFLLHSLQISHTHSGHNEYPDSSHHDTPGSDEMGFLGEYIHAAEKKVYLFIASVWSLTINSLPQTHILWPNFLCIVGLLCALLLCRNARLVLHNYLILFFASGRLNPKLF